MPPFCAVFAPGRSRLRLAGRWPRTALANVRRNCRVSQGVVMTSMSPMPSFSSAKAASIESSGNLKVCFCRLNRSSSSTSAGTPSSSRATPLSWVSQTMPRILKASPPARARRRSGGDARAASVAWEPVSVGAARFWRVNLSQKAVARQCLHEHLMFREHREFRRCVIMPSWQTRKAAPPPVVRALPAPSSRCLSRAPSSAGPPAAPASRCRGRSWRSCRRRTPGAPAGRARRWPGSPHRARRAGACLRASARSM